MAGSFGHVAGCMVPGERPDRQSELAGVRQGRSGHLP